MELEFGFKELYDVILIANQELTINGTTFSEGDPIIFFDEVQIASINTQTSKVAATGGFDNRAQVTWESTKAAGITFSRGIFSKEQFGILTNYRLLTDNTPVTFLQKEALESDKDGKIVLSHSAANSNIKIINKATRDKISYNILNETTLSIEAPYTDVIVLYYITYTNTKTHLLIGSREINGFITLQGKTRTKDDITGIEKTGLIVFPKLQLISNFNVRLGNKAIPVMADFSALAHPVGGRGREKVGDFYFLSEDIDAL